MFNLKLFKCTTQALALKKPTDTVYIRQRHTSTEVPCAYAYVILVSLRL